MTLGNIYKMKIKGKGKIVNDYKCFEYFIEIRFEFDS